MHPYADWIIRNTQCFPNNDTVTLPDAIACAKNIYIDTDGSLPRTEKAYHGLVWALVVHMEDNDGQFALLGFLASQLQYSGSLHQTTLKLTIHLQSLLAPYIQIMDCSHRTKVPHTHLYRLTCCSQYIELLPSAR